MTNILIVGVGGQGSLLASKVLGSVFLQQGLDVKVNEVHGMSQRGGSVETTVRADSKTVQSPLIPDGEVDILIALERLEALRYAHTLSPNAAALISTQRIAPMPVLTGAASYPEYESLNAKTVFVDALGLARQAGSVKAANIVMLGAAARFIGAKDELWQIALAECVKPKLLEINRAAFNLGKNGVGEE
ncbi:indolepyruvate oxidoreductase [Clostridia bacterium]|nr:indolepyruvate oxidoreductase [Clostridia bacterium]